MPISFEDIETDNGTCSPIKVVVSMLLRFSFDIQIYSKGKTATFLESFWSSVSWISNESSSPKNVSRS